MHFNSQSNKGINLVNYLSLKMSYLNLNLSNLRSLWIHLFMPQAVYRHIIKKKKLPATVTVRPVDQQTEIFRPWASCRPLLEEDETKNFNCTFLGNGVFLTNFVCCISFCQRDP